MGTWAAVIGRFAYLNFSAKLKNRRGGASGQNENSLWKSITLSQTGRILGTVGSCFFLCSIN